MPGNQSAFSGLVLLYIRHSGNIPFPIFPGESSRDILIAGPQEPDPDSQQGDKNFQIGFFFKTVECE